MKASILIFFMSFAFLSCTNKMKAQEVSEENLDSNYETLTNLDYKNLEKAKASYKQGNQVAKTAVDKLLKDANKALKEDPFSVVNKTQVPVSGSKHDYLSLGPYWWPDPEKEDGLPWIRKDGEVNPLTREASTDYETKNQMFHNTSALAMAYFFSDKTKYAEKALKLIEVWFINEDTKMNPNLNFAQGIPGKNTGRGIGIIEFSGITNIITAIEILELNDVMDTKTSQELRQWFTDYLNWLQTSENGIFEKNTKNNHAVYYDIQEVSIFLFLNKNEEAKQVLEDVKTKRIATQIEPDGKQPHELARTKSLSYSTMNLSGFTKLAFLGSKVNIDLWNYEADNGASIIKAYEFLKPYAKGEKEWEYKQIHSLSKSKQRLRELFARAGSQFNIPEYCEIGSSNKKEVSSFLNNCF